MSEFTFDGPFGHIEVYGYPAGGGGGFSGLSLNFLDDTTAADLTLEPVLRIEPSEFEHILATDGVTGLTAYHFAFQATVPGGTILIRSYTSSEWQVDHIATFADGTSLDLYDVQDFTIGTLWSDRVVSGAGPLGVDWALGFDGSDTLVGGDNDAILAGGWEGEDRYEFAAPPDGSTRHYAVVDEWQGDFRVSSARIAVSGVSPDEMRLQYGQLDAFAGVEYGDDPDRKDLGLIFGSGLEVTVVDLDRLDYHPEQTLLVEFDDGTVIDLLSMPVILTGEGVDTLAGTHLDDRIVSRPADEILDGITGHDTYVFDGAFGHDTLAGSGAGRDPGDAAQGMSTVEFGAGIRAEDLAFHVSGRDIVIEVAGGSSLTLAGAYDTDLGAIAADLIEIRLADGTVVDLTEQTMSRIEVGADTPTIRALPGADLILSDDAANWIDGAAGDDTIQGGPGDDNLMGGDGADSLSGGLDDDRLAGGLGNDELDGGRGDDRLVGEGGKDTIHGGSGNDHAQGGAGADLIFGDGGDDTLTGDEGRDTIDGGRGNDRIGGGDAPDLLMGDVGNDTLTGGFDFDTLIGGRGDDLLRSSAPRGASDLSGDDMSGGNGNDSLIGDAGDDSLSGGRQDDALHGGRGDDTLRGNQDADRLSGEDGMDSLDGGKGTDTLDGGGGDDTLVGNDGDDVLLGGEGSDHLVGGAGRDRLTGGRAGDIFGFSKADDSAPGAADVITDLSSRDRINLQRIDADTTEAGDQHFVFVDHFSHSAGELTASVQDDLTILRGDTDGDGSADFMVRLLHFTDPLDHIVLL
ncbi:calcium-binding protein [Acuticoccus sediminis]|nr:calcium-binding protein [Acuticoccus sediminis]